MQREQAGRQESGPHALAVSTCTCRDGGRYLKTWGTVVARTPDGRWTNWAIAQVMLLDRNRLTGIAHTLQHLGQIHGTWKRIGKPMPFAMFQGGPPFIAFVSSMPAPHGCKRSRLYGRILRRAS
ncbi:MAG TPA: UbiD family decarboxylase domain-containing protein [Bryobacteraceae bacterium]|nr:UbiD family decarboxylase domain-containing protein [Bryobacteraceae bacterium]